MSDYPDWIKHSLERIKTAQIAVLIDTEAKARAEGVPIGTTVMHRRFPFYPNGMQDQMDDFHVWGLIRSGEIPHPGYATEDEQ